MKCRACGAEIAEKAIVCYRCGAPTATPQARAVTPRPRPWLAAAGAIAAAGAALTTAAVWPGERVVAEIVGSAAVVVLGVFAVIRWPRR